MKRPKKTAEAELELEAATPDDDDDDAPPATPANVTQLRPKKAPRGRHVQGWLEKTFGEGTGQEWPKAADRMWPMLRSLIQQQGESVGMSTGDIRVKVSRLSGDGPGGETPITPAFDASCIDRENPDDAVIEYVEDWYHLPAEASGIEGKCTYRLEFIDKKTGQKIKTAELTTRSIKEIKRAREMRKPQSGDATAYAGERPAMRAAPAAGVAGDPYTAEAVHNLRVELAATKSAMRDEMLSVLRELGVGARAEAPPAAAAPAAPVDPKREATVLVMSILEELGISRTTHAAPAAAPPPDDPLVALAKEQQRMILDKIKRKMQKELSKGDDDDDDEKTEKVPEVTAEVVGEIPKPQPEEKAPFRGLPVEGAPLYKGERIMYPVDRRTGDFSFKGLFFTNPELAKDLLGALREAGEPVMQAFAKLIERAAQDAEQAGGTTHPSGGYANGAGGG